MQLRESQLPGILAERSGKVQGVLVYGSNVSAVSELAQAICSRESKQDGATAVMRLDASVLKSDPARVADEYGALSLLGDRQIILVTGCDDSCLAAVTALLGMPVSGNFVVLVADALSKTSKLRLACEAAKDFYCVPVYEETDSELRQRITRYMATLGLKMNQDALDVFLELVGNDRSTAMREAEKLGLYCHGQADISDADVLAVCDNTASHSVEELSDAIMAGELGEADRIFAHMDRDAGQPAVVLMQLLFQVQRLQVMSLDMSGGASVESAMQRAKPPVFNTRKQTVARHLRKIDLDVIEQMVRSLSRAIADTRAHSDLADTVSSREVFRLVSLTQAQR